MARGALETDTPKDGAEAGKAKAARTPQAAAAATPVPAVEAEKGRHKHRLFRK